MDKAKLEVKHGVDGRIVVTFVGECAGERYEGFSVIVQPVDSHHRIAIRTFGDFFLTLEKYLTGEEDETKEELVAVVEI